MNFYYDEEAIRYLKAKDPILADIIDRIGPIERPIDADLFSALVNNIVGQQISMKAQETVWKRMLAAFGAITPENLFRASVEEIQQCGLSTRKATYIREAAEKVLSGEFDLEELKDMSDEAVIAELSQLRGIGKWTAEMLLIFSMGRQDVLSWTTSPSIAACGWCTITAKSRNSCSRNTSGVTRHTVRLRACIFGKCPSAFCRI